MQVRPRGPSAAMLVRVGEEGRSGVVRDRAAWDRAAARRAYNDTGQRGVLAGLPTLPVPGYVMSR
jgi:hypothetical protein